MKPSWDDAPPWANYLVTNRDGTWTWWEHAPEAGHTAWFATTLTGKKIAAIPTEETFQDSLERRP